MTANTAAVPIKALAFDAYGTLFDVNSVTTTTEELFPGSGKKISQIWRLQQLQYTWLLSLMGHHHDFFWVTEQALRFACQSLNLELADSSLQRLLDQYGKLSTYPEVATALKTLGEQYSLAILSNGSPAMLSTVAANAQLINLFSHILSAEPAGIFKPNPKVYQLAVDAFGFPASEIGFVSSNNWDVSGAKAFGFQTYWLNRSGQPGLTLGFPADHVFQNMSDLVAMLQLP
ncbi:MAG: haloacid dehalogenase type II [Synechococcaceae cyanobacterium SM2_3_1]|nr:haloacid dehalogenase type II [Synechococcaceae cyanobacterium SM2_3_1]